MKKLLITYLVIPGAMFAVFFVFYRSAVKEMDAKAVAKAEAQKKADAENLKGELALLGIEAAVSEVTLPEKGKMYRVRSGPYAKAEEMNRVRTQLSQGGVQATVVKVKE